MSRQIEPNLNRTDTKQYPTKGVEIGGKHMTTESDEKKKKRPSAAELKTKLRIARKFLRENSGATFSAAAAESGLSVNTMTRYFGKGKKKARKKYTRKAITKKVIAKKESTPLKRSGELQTLVQNLEDAKKALRDYLEAYLSL